MLTRVLKIVRIGLVGVVLNFLLVCGVCAMEESTMDNSKAGGNSNIIIDKKDENIVAKYLDGDNILYRNSNYDGNLQEYFKVDVRQYEVWLNNFKEKLLSEYNALISDIDCAEIVKEYNLKPIKNIDEVKGVYKDSLNKAREWLEYKLISKFVSDASNVARVCHKVVNFWKNYIPFCRDKRNCLLRFFDDSAYFLGNEVNLISGISGYEERPGVCVNGIGDHCNRLRLRDGCYFCALMSFYSELNIKFQNYSGGYFKLSNYFADPVWYNECTSSGNKKLKEFYKKLYNKHCNDCAERYKKLYLYRDKGKFKVKDNVEPSLRDYYIKYQKFPFFVQFVNIFVSHVMCSALVSVKKMEDDLFNNVFVKSSEFSDGYGCVSSQYYAKEIEKIIEDNFNIEEFGHCFEERVGERCKLTFKNMGNIFRKFDEQKYNEHVHSCEIHPIGDRYGSFSYLDEWGDFFWKEKRYPYYEEIFGDFEDYKKQYDSAVENLFDFFYQSSIDSKFKKLAYLISLGNIFEKEDIILSPKSFLNFDNYLKILNEC